MGRPRTSDLSRRTLALVMAGGSGSRLAELTRSQCKPALPVGGQYRSIDFPLSNCLNSGVRRIALLTQYKSHSLIQHVQQGWSFLRPDTGEFVELWPAQQQRGEAWYAGTADALCQNIDLISHHAPDYVLILAGDQVYKMDYLEMIERHVESGAAATIACIEVPVEEASAYGVVTVDTQGWIRQFDEKPPRPKPTPHDQRVALASMGIYVFDRARLIECLLADAADPRSSRDFGHDVLPRLIRRSHVLSHTFRDARTGAPAYWRDVGTIDSYWQTNLELLSEPPELDLYDESWPIRTYLPQCPPPLFVGDGNARRSIVAHGCRIAGGVQRSLLSANCRIDSGTAIDSSVVLPDVTIGRECRIRRAIIDSGCRVPDGTVIGDDLLDESAYRISSKGVTLVTADMLTGQASARRERRHVA